MSAETAVHARTPSGCGPNTLATTMAARQITYAELCEHNKETDLWILIDGKGTCIASMLLTQSTM